MTNAAQHNDETPANAFGDELPAGSQLCGGSYVIEKYLNSGGFGITYLARDSLGRRVVIKECFPSAMCFRTDRTVRLRSRNSDTEFETILELFEKEARALSDLNHPYVVGVHQIFHDNNTAYMAIDFVDGQDLQQVIEGDPGRLDPASVHELLLRCLEAVQYIHESDVLHRDISPDNILLDREGFPVFIDFGAARESATRVSRVLSKVLTVKDGYSPQEFYLQGSQQVYSSDLYALAATFYHLITGAPPPSSHTRMAAVAGELPDPFEPLDREVAEGFEQSFIDAINTNLELFPENRMPTAVDWRDTIDVERRRKILLELAEEDRDLEEKVYKLVAEFRQSVQADELAVQAKAPKKAAPQEPRQKARKKVRKSPQEAKRRPARPMVLDEPTNAEGGNPAPREATRLVKTPEEAVQPAEQPVAKVDETLTQGDAVAPKQAGERKPRGLKKFLSGTKELILGQSKARFE